MTTELPSTDEAARRDGSPLTEGLGPLLPEREGQPRTLTMAQPWELERGHWYSPAAVREMLAAERERYAIALREWAVSRWRAEVEHRPLENRNRRTLDDTWRQVMRYAGLDSSEAVGPSHDELLASRGA